MAKKEAPVRGSEHLAGLGAGLLRESAAAAPEWLAWGPSDGLPGPAGPSPPSADAFHSWSSLGNFSASESASLWLWGEHPPEFKQPLKPDTRHTSVTPSKALAWTAALRGHTEGGGPWP